MAYLPKNSFNSACRCLGQQKMYKTLATSTSHVLPSVGSISTDSQSLKCTYSTAIKAYHKKGLTGFVYNLSTQERAELLQMLSSSSEPSSSTDKITTPSRSQLKYVALFSGVPFIGFGVLDNTIMLTAGEYIDITFGTWLGITTMAAAALGNMISDVLGITTAGFVEQTALKLGLKAPPITLEQMSLRRTKFVANVGRCIGVCIGCVIGMWPLLVFAKESEEKRDTTESNKS